MRIYEEIEPPPAPGDPGDIKWHSLSFNDNQKSIQDVTLKILRQQNQSKAKTSLNESEPAQLSGGSTRQNWHVLPQHQASSTDNSDGYIETAMVSVNQNGVVKSPSLPDVSNIEKCSNCIKYNAREKRLRDRLRMAETFIRTMNRNLETDTVAISTIINKRTQLMNKLEESNLQLHREKHRCQSDLVDAETQLYENKTKVQHLEADNEDLKTLVDKLTKIRSKVSEGENHIGQIDSGKNMILETNYNSGKSVCFNDKDNDYKQSSLDIAQNLKNSGNVVSSVPIQPSSNKQVIDVDTSATGKCMPNRVNSLNAAQRKQQEKISRKVFSPENETVYEVPFKICEPTKSSSTPKKDSSSVIATNSKSNSIKVSSLPNQSFTTDGVKKCMPSLNSLYTAQRKQLEKTTRKEVEQLNNKQLKILWGIEKEGISKFSSNVDNQSSQLTNKPKRDTSEVASNADDQPSQPPLTSTPIKKDTSKRCSFTAKETQIRCLDENFISKVWNTPVESASPTDSQSQSSITMSQSLDGAQTNDFDQYLAESSHVSDKKLCKNQEIDKCISSTKSLNVESTKAQASTKYTIQDRSKSSIPTYNHYPRNEVLDTKKQSSIKDSSSKLPTYAEPADNHCVARSLTSGIEQGCGNQKQSAKRDSLVSKSCVPPVHTKFVDHQSLKEDFTKLLRDCADQNSQNQRQSLISDLPTNKSSAHTKFVEQGIEEDCQTDECYILRLKDQTKGIREELMNIQNLLTDFKE